MQHEGGLAGRAGLSRRARRERIRDGTEQPPWRSTEATAAVLDGAPIPSHHPWRGDVARLRPRLCFFEWLFDLAWWNPRLSGSARLPAGRFCIHLHSFSPPKSLENKLKLPWNSSGALLLCKLLDGLFCAMQQIINAIMFLDCVIWPLMKALRGLTIFSDGLKGLTKPRKAL